MRIVIDSNRLQSEELRAFLSLAPENHAVITDYAAMEAFQGDTLRSIQASWEVLKDFPNQIVVLKGTRAAALVDPRAAGIGNRLIDKSQTRGVKDFARVLEHAGAGNRAAQRQLLQRGKWADDHMAKMLAGAENMELSISEFAGVFTEAEIKRMRRRETWKQETAEKFFRLVVHLTQRSFEAHPDKPPWPHHKHLTNHFLYRHALAYCVYMMQLVRRGAVVRKAKLVRNDSVDVIFATFATYFNGFMSGDEQASVIHHLTRFLLVEQRARVPEDYMESYASVIADHLDAAADCA
jgi:hypothetical protein